MLALLARAAGPRAVGRRALCAAAGARPPHFDTHEAVVQLEAAGFSKEQAEGAVNVLRSVVAQSSADATTLMASKEDLAAVSSSLNEKVFNSTLKFDIAQRHARELLSRDLETLRSDLRAVERQDHIALQQEIATLEKASLTRRAEEDERFASVQTDIERVEKRMIQYSLGFVGAASTIGLGIARLLS